MENQKGIIRSPQKSLLSKRMQTLIAHPHTLNTKPEMYQVVLVNDNVTPRDYVLHCLEEHFFKATDMAHSLILNIEQGGEAVCGRYTREMAETKIAEVIADARCNNYPLKCVMRKVK